MDSLGYHMEALRFIDKAFAIEPDRVLAQAIWFRQIFITSSDNRSGL